MRKKCIDHQGKQHNSLGAMCKFFGIYRQLYYVRERNGWSLEKILTTPVGETKKITFRGITYKTHQEFADAMVKTKQTLYSRTTIIIRLPKCKKSDGSIDEKKVEKLLSSTVETIDEGGVIYKITSLRSNKVYIGKTVQDPNKRWNDHQWEALNTDEGGPLKDEIRKEGVEFMKFEVIAEAPNSEKLNELELWFISKYNSVYPNGLNGNNGGGGSSGVGTVVTYKNKKYASLMALGKAYGINGKNIVQRINAYGMSIDEAVNAGSDMREFEYKGIVYPNRKAYILQNDKNPQTIACRMSNGYTFEEAMNLLDGESICPICENKFQPKSTRHKYCSNKCKWKAKNSKKNCKESSEGFRNITVIKGKKFRSDVEVSKYFNIGRQSFRSRLKRGMSAVEAIIDINPKAIDLIKALDN